MSADVYGHAIFAAGVLSAARVFARYVVPPVMRAVVGLLWTPLGGIRAYDAHQQLRAAERFRYRSLPLLHPVRLRWFWGQRLGELVLLAALPVAVIFGPLVVYGAIAHVLGWLG